jgi:DNA polymerase-3 subunit epsilon
VNTFAAIDFEVANAHRSSICSIGIAIVKDGAIVSHYSRLVRPSPNYYLRNFTNIHGITYFDTEQEEGFPEVWVQVSALIKDLPLVAHNSRFEEGCLRAVHALFDMEYPNYTFFCTYRASRLKLKDQVRNYKLPTVAAHCGYILKNHHNALADAEACASIAIKLL